VDLDECDIDEDEDMHVFGSLKCCSQGALDSRTNFWGTSQLYILYLWDYLHAHNLLKMSFQRLDPKVAAKIGGKGVPSILRFQLAKHSPSDESSMLGTRISENEDVISVSIDLLGENNLRAVRLESNATEKNTLHNLLYNLQMQRRQIIINRLKAMSAFDNPLGESLAEQMREIDDEILQLTADLDSVLGSELSTPPRKNPRTPMF
jgi:hypothetical protein